MRKPLYLIAAAFVAVAVATSITGAATPTPLATPVCLKTDGVNASVITCPTVVTTTTSSATTTLPATTTTTTVATTTTTGPAGSFLSYPHASSAQSFSGSNVVVSNRSYVGFTSGTCLTVHDATNVWIHNVDFDSCGGDVFLVNVTGTVTVENVRGRNTGNGNIGSGQGNLVQFNNVHSCSATIRNNSAYGGRTEDMISIFKSGGCDATHPLDVYGNHLESPLSGPLAWTSTSGTCINAADYGGGNIHVHDNTLLNCGAIGLQMHQPNPNVVDDHNIVYGAARTSSNVGISQWSATSCNCGADVGNRYTVNRVFWQKANGSASPAWFSHTYPVTADTQSTTQDPSTPQVHVSL